MSETQPSRPDEVEAVILPRAHDLGGFEVRRALPAKEKQMIGPFIFFDQMGPGEFLTGKGLDVRPHPHIGLATVTYLFDGSILHRDSLGTQLPIVPGDVNWMTAGSGIAHSERTDAKLRTHSNSLFGIQSWVALPKAMEETSPAFAHHAADSLPVVDRRRCPAAPDCRRRLGPAIPGRDARGAVLRRRHFAARGRAAAAG